jgi:hypothetical protein
MRVFDSIEFHHLSLPDFQVRIPGGGNDNTVPLGNLGKCTAPDAPAIAIQPANQVRPVVDNDILTAHRGIVPGRLREGPAVFRLHEPKN